MTTIRIAKDYHCEDEYCWFAKMPGAEGYDEDYPLNIADFDGITAVELAESCAVSYRLKLAEFHVYMNDDRDYVSVEFGE